jgi:hypothetical protein
MLSTNDNDYDHIGRERQVIELYKQGKSTRDIAKELRMSLRDISMSEYVDGSFRCSICAKEFPTKDAADRHYQDVHANQDIEIGE